MFNRIKEVCLKNFNILFILIFIYVVYLSIFDSSQLFYSMNSFILMVGSCLGLLMFRYLFIALKKCKKKTLVAIIFFSFFFMILIQLLVGYNMVVKPGWDFSKNFNTAIQIANGSYSLDEYYWASYPNNIGSTILLGILFKPLTYFTDNISYFICYAILINIIMILISQIGLVWLVLRKKGLRIATFTSIFILFITPFYCYVPIVYTDTLGMLFPIWGVITIDIYESSKSTKKYLWLILTGLIITSGVIIKTNVIITLVAIVIYFIIKYNFFDAIKKIMLILIVFTGIMVGYKEIVQRMIPIPYNEAGLPATHWVMMGLTGNGWYNVEDVKISQQIYHEQGKKAVKEVNLQVIKDRLKDYGVKGYLKFLNHKLTINWNDGTYFAVEKLKRDPIKNTKMHSYIIGENKSYYVYMSQFMYIILFFGIVLSAIKNFKSKINIYTLGYIALFGTMLFLLLWESRSRYIVIMLPMMIYCSIDGLEILERIRLPKLKK